MREVDGAERPGREGRGGRDLAAKLLEEVCEGGSLGNRDFHTWAAHDLGVGREEPDGNDQATLRGARGHGDCGAVEVNGCMGKDLGTGDQKALQERGR